MGDGVNFLKSLFVVHSKVNLPRRLLGLSNMRYLRCFKSTYHKYSWLPQCVSTTILWYGFTAGCFSKSGFKEYLFVSWKTATSQTNDFGTNIWKHEETVAIHDSPPLQSSSASSIKTDSMQMGSTCTCTHLYKPY